MTSLIRKCSLLVCLLCLVGLSTVQAYPQDTGPMKEDEKKANENIEALLKTLDLPVGNLKIMAHKLIAHIHGELEFGRAIAQLEEHEKLLDELITDSDSELESITTKRKDIIAEMEKQLENATKFEAQDKKACDEAQILILEAYHPTLLSFKHNETRLRKFVTAAKFNRGKVRAELRTLKTMKKLTVAGLEVRKRTKPDLPPLDTLPGTEPFDFTKKRPASNAKSPEELRKQMAHLFE